MRDPIAEQDIRIEVILPDGTSVQTTGPEKPSRPKTSREEAPDTLARLGDSPE